jgi:hypothetical protein
MWLWAMQIGWVGFLLALCGFILRGCQRDGGLQPGAWRWLLLSGGCFALWMVALKQIPVP